jgi:hypothetical protein
MAIVLCTPSTVVPAKSQQNGYRLNSITNDFSDIPQEVIDDAGSRAVTLFGKKKKDVLILSARCWQL